MSNPATAVVLGGGIWGLTCARALLRGGYPGQVLVLDESTRAGGKIRTLGTQGYSVETAANGFLNSNPATMELCKELGLGDRLVAASGTAARNRFIFLRGRLHRLPAGIWGALGTGVVSWWAKWRVATERFRRPSIPSGDESIADFGRRRFGRELTETLLDAFVTGIWGGDPETLSVRSCFPRWHEWETRYGSLTGGMVARRRERGDKPGMWSLKGGLGELMAALARDCGDSVRLNSKVLGICHTPHKGKPWELRLETGPILADHVVLATPPDIQAGFLRPLDPVLAGELAAIRSNSIAVVAMGFPKGDVTKHLDGFGYLSPQRERRPVLGVQWCSDIFPGMRAPEGKALWRALVGDPGNTGVLGASDADLVRLVLEEMALVTGLKARPEMVEIIRWPKAIPQYELGHGKRVETIVRLAGHWPGLHLGGSGLNGVSLNDCVEQARLLARSVLASANARF